MKYMDTKNIENIRTEIVQCLFFYGPQTFDELETNLKKRASNSEYHWSQIKYNLKQLIETKKIKSSVALANDTYKIVYQLGV